MNKAELKKRLDNCGIDKTSYSLDQGDRNECFCLEKGYRGWSVYYSERGNRNDETFFRREEDACEYIFDLLSGDKSTHSKVS